MSLFNPNIGRRTGVDIKAGKNIKVLENGFEDFDDYWTDTDGEDETFLKILAEKENESETSSRKPSNKLDKTKVRSMSPFTSREWSDSNHMLRQNSRVQCNNKQSNSELHKNGEDDKNKDKGNSSESANTDGRTSEINSKDTTQKKSAKRDVSKLDTEGMASEKVDEGTISKNGQKVRSVKKSSIPKTCSDTAHKQASKEKVADDSFNRSKGTVTVDNSGSTDQSLNNRESIDRVIDSTQELEDTNKGINPYGEVNGTITAGEQEMDFNKAKINSAVNNFKTRKRLRYSGLTSPEELADSFKKTSSSTEFKQPLPMKAWIRKSTEHTGNSAVTRKSTEHTGNSVVTARKQSVGEKTSEQTDNPVVTTNNVIHASEHSDENTCSTAQLAHISNKNKSNTVCSSDKDSNSGSTGTDAENEQGVSSTGTDTENEQGVSDTQSDNEGNIDTQTDNDGNIDTQSDNEGNIDTQTDNEGNIDTQTDNDCNIDTQTDNDSNIDTQTDNDGKTDTQSDNDGNIDTQSDNDDQIDSRSDNEGNINTQSDNDGNIDTQSDNNDQIGTQSDNDDKIDTQNDNDGNIDSEQEIVSIKNVEKLENHMQNKSCIKKAGVSSKQLQRKSTVSSKQPMTVRSDCDYVSESLSEEEGPESPAFSMLSRKPTHRQLHSKHVTVDSELKSLSGKESENTETIKPGRKSVSTSRKLSVVNINRKSSIKDMENNEEKGPDIEMDQLKTQTDNKVHKTVNKSKKKGKNSEQSKVVDSSEMVDLLPKRSRRTRSSNKASVSKPSTRQGRKSKRVASKNLMDSVDCEELSCTQTSHGAQKELPCIQETSHGAQKELPCIQETGEVDELSQDMNEEAEHQELTDEALKQMNDEVQIKEVEESQVQEIAESQSQETEKSQSQETEKSQSQEIEESQSQEIGEFESQETEQSQSQESPQLSDSEKIEPKTVTEKGFNKSQESPQFSDSEKEKEIEPKTVAGKGFNKSTCEATTSSDTEHEDDFEIVENKLLSLKARMSTSISVQDVQVPKQKKVNKNTRKVNKKDDPVVKNRRVKGQGKYGTAKGGVKTASKQDQEDKQTNTLMPSKVIKDGVKTKGKSNKSKLIPCVNQDNGEKRVTRSLAYGQKVPLNTRKLKQPKQGKKIVTRKGKQTTSLPLKKLQNKGKVKRTADKVLSCATGPSVSNPSGAGPSLSKPSTQTTLYTDKHTEDKETDNISQDLSKASEFLPTPKTVTKRRHKRRLLADNSSNGTLFTDSGAGSPTNRLSLSIGSSQSMESPQHSQSPVQQTTTQSPVGRRSSHPTIQQTESAHSAVKHIQPHSPVRRRSSHPYLTTVTSPPMVDLTEDEDDRHTDADDEMASPPAPKKVKKITPRRGKGRKYKTSTASGENTSPQPGKDRKRKVEKITSTPATSAVPKVQPKSILKNSGKRTDGTAVDHTSVIPATPEMSSYDPYLAMKTPAVEPITPVSKKAVKIILPSPPLEEGIRRSKRVRVKTLDWFRGERILYGRRKSGGFGVTGLSSPWRLEEERQEKRNKKENQTKGFKQARLKVKPSGQPNITAKNLSAHVDLPSEVEMLEDSVVPVINPQNQEEVYIECVKKSNSYQFISPSGEPGTDTDPLVLCKVMKQPAFSLGLLVIRPLEVKDTQFVRRDTMVFIVKYGKVAVTVHRTTTILENDETFFVPQGNTYSIKNLRNDEAKLWYFQHKGDRGEVKVT